MTYCLYFIRSTSRRNINMSLVVNSLLGLLILIVENGDGINLEDYNDYKFQEFLRLYNFTRREIYPSSFAEADTIRRSRFMIMAFLIGLLCYRIIRLFWIGCFCNSYFQIEFNERSFQLDANDDHIDEAGERISDDQPDVHS